jgi:hypothetical protein
MELDNRTLLVVQVVLSIVAWSTVAVVFIRPRLAALEPRTALRWLIAPHMFRHIGMSLLATGVPGPGLDPSFASWVATGDLITMLLATVTVIALGRPGRLGLALAALTTAVGLLDLLHNLRSGLVVGAANHLQGGWIVVAIVVPLMLVAHVAAVRMLVRRETWSRP